MLKKESKSIVAKETETALAQQTEVLGFENEETNDMIIPRVKVIQTLSPERREGIAEEGDILNSLTREKHNGSKFIPVFKFNNNIEWRERSDGGGIKCIARDGKVGESLDGKTVLCTACRRNEFDNSKQGREAAPKCTKYINFFGFFEGERMPIILSFGKTNYNEGRKLYSLAKVTMQNMWNYGYTLHEKLMAKSGNEWYIITTAAAGVTSEEDREFAYLLYKQYRSVIQSISYDMDESATSTSAAESDPDIDNVEF